MTGPYVNWFNALKTLEQTGAIEMSRGSVR
jgi:hypothetical protein